MSTASKHFKKWNIHIGERFTFQNAHVTFLNFFYHACVIPTKCDDKKVNKIKIWLTLLYAMPSGQGVTLRIKAILQQDMGVLFH